MSNRFNELSNEALEDIRVTQKRQYGLFLILIILVLYISIGFWNTCTAKEQKQNTSDDFKWHGKSSLILKDIQLPKTQIKTDKAMEKFLSSNRKLALLASIPKENIYIYGLKTNSNNNEDAFIYKLQGIYIRHCNDIQVLDIPWGIYGHIPQIRYFDYDDDGQKEVAMIVRSDSGTDLSLYNLHILEESQDGGFVDNQFAHTDWAKQLNKILRYTIQNGIIKLWINERVVDKIDIAAFEKEWGEKLRSIAFGNNIKFEFKKNKIILSANPRAYVGKWVTSQNVTPLIIEKEVTYHKNRFKLK